VNRTDGAVFISAEDLWEAFQLNKTKKTPVKAKRRVGEYIIEATLNTSVTQYIICFQYIKEI